MRVLFIFRSPLHTSEHVVQKADEQITISYGVDATKAARKKFKRG
jgi:hypothetical protein